MIYGYDFSLKAGASYFKSKQCLNKMTKESKYYLSDEYTDSANPVICLVKFVSKPFLISTLLGNLHFSSLYQFRMMETEGNDHKIGDTYEGIYPCDISKRSHKLTKEKFEPKFLYAKIHNWHMKPVATEKGYGLSDQDAKKVGLASFYVLRKSNFDNVNVSADSLKENKMVLHKLNQMVLNMMHNFNQEGRIPVIVPMMKDVIIMFKQNSEYQDLVNYVDEKSPAESTIIDKINENSMVAAFFKRNKYKEQLEYRFINNMENINNTGLKHFKGLEHYIFPVRNEDLKNLRMSWVI
ncbi:hypothetical protein ODV12_06715 [Lactobacillus amylovorus]|uniref:hypothetical protein n=1 Tax=Lactobacillus amylovorus TaxID=1604 RepID=UPI00232E2848|nr:hypothetical protein [Lactobacillus amylovorus]MDB6250918.1 hypothetical protein [Lactobacillus amylovorus]